MLEVDDDVISDQHRYLYFYFQELFVLFPLFPSEASRLAYKSFQDLRRSLPKSVEP